MSRACWRMPRGRHLTAAQGHTALSQSAGHVVAPLGKRGRADSMSRKPVRGAPKQVGRIRRAVPHHHNLPSMRGSYRLANGATLVRRLSEAWQHAFVRMTSHHLTTRISFRTIRAAPSHIPVYCVPSTGYLLNAMLHLFSFLGRLRRELTLSGTNSSLRTQPCSFRLVRCR